jgi:hypothetical protein
MNEDNIKILKEKYPKIFVNLGTPRHTMNHISFRDGWFTLVNRLCGLIQNYVDNNGIEQVVAVQVKQKFGELRFYYNGGDDIVAGMVRMAECMSHVICEDCGNAAKTQDVNGGFYRSVCDIHAKKTQDDINAGIW